MKVRTRRKLQLYSEDPIPEWLVIKKMIIKAVLRNGSGVELNLNLESNLNDAKILFDCFLTACSTTSLPDIRETNNDVTTRTSLKLQKDQQRRRSSLSHRQETPPPSSTGVATPTPGYTLPFLLTCLLIQVLLLLRFTSWPQEGASKHTIHT